LKFWRVVRWPFLVLFGGFAFIYLLIGLIGSVGFFGTTPLHPVSAKSDEWKGFQSLWGAKKGKPYSWKDGREPSVDGGIAKFDRRLVEALTYLASNNKTKCGWDGQHEQIVLSLDAPVVADTSKPPENLTSNSTVNRGVGVRVDSADKIKCTRVPRPNGNRLCTPDGLPKKFKTERIPLVLNKLVTPDLAGLDLVNCEYTCAVDYYPNDPTDAMPQEKAKPSVVPLVADLDPGLFSYLDITDNAKSAAIYKTALIIYELLSIDDPNCQSVSGNLGWQRLIPTTIIVPKWISDKMGDKYKEFISLGVAKFPYQFQIKSSLSGLSLDFRLDNKGLHYNF